MIEWVAAGLAFGAFGSVHCVGMCGPLALSLPGKHQPRWQFWAERGLYNLGRAVTYSLLGVLVGAAGHVVSLAGAQQGLSVGIGVLMILVAAVPWVSRQVQRIEQTPSAFLGRVMKPIGTLYETGGPTAMLIVGLLNGLLPCGFVYAALATAVTADGVAQSTVFMAGFGLGTGPAMLGVSLLGRVASTKLRTRLQNLVPIGLALVGLLLILRGLGLGSMLSPALG
ncbi:MAG: sulfite exporter TauE/SafE family protein [Salinivenus sp.]